MSKPKIKVEQLYKSFGSHHVLQGVNIEVMPDRSLVILGGSGTGKSVLIKTMVGLLSPDSGSIKYDGIESIGMSQSDRLETLENYGFLFQGGALFDSLTIQENIVFFASKIKKMNKNERSELAAEKLNSVGLSPRILNLFPSELSGGMQKRVSLARAICTSPKIIFFDEPTTGLDPIMANVINDLIIKVREELGATTVTITHDMHSARVIGTDVAMLHEGKVIWHGDVEEMDDADNPFLSQFIKGKTKGPIRV